MFITISRKALAILVSVVVCVGLMDQAAFAQNSTKKTSASASKNTSKKSTTTRSSAKKKSTVKPKKTKPKPAVSSARRPVAPTNKAEKFAALVVDAKTGQILYDVNGDDIRHPASLTKMMTLYLLFEQMKKGNYSLDSMMPVSAKAAGMAQTNIYLTEGDRISVKTAIESLIIRSANDSAMVVAEAIGGSQEGFARLMNAKAKQLGMTATRFTNPNGLPDEDQVTNAHDMARLGIALRRDFPQYYRYFSQTEFSFRGRDYEGHNRLLGRYPGADGIKTGYIRMSGFNLVTSVKRGNWQLVGVIMGGTTGAARDRQMMEMLDDVFATLSKR